MADMVIYQTWFILEECSLDLECMKLKEVYKYVLFPWIMYLLKYTVAILVEINLCWILLVLVLSYAALHIGRIQTKEMSFLCY